MAALASARSGRPPGAAADHVRDRRGPLAPGARAELARGYKQSRPVRVGNLAAKQIQLDVYGELMDALHAGREARLSPLDEAWRLQKTLLEHLEGVWDKPDHGIWETRGPERHFTHSRLMSWVAFDRAVKSWERFELDGPVDRWRELREQIREDILAHGFDERRRNVRAILRGPGPRRGTAVDSAGRLLARERPACDRYRSRH